MLCVGYAHNRKIKRHYAAFTRHPLLSLIGSLQALPSNG